MEVQTGEVLQHLESGAEVAYKAAIPTIGHGVIHLLVGAEGYILKFTSELEKEFNVPVASAPVTADPFGGATSEEVQELLRLLRAKGGAATQATPGAAVTDTTAVEGPDEPDLGKVAQTGVEEPQAEPVAPAPTSGGIAL
jgi:hypothetical protein